MDVYYGETLNVNDGYSLNAAKKNYWDKPEKPDI